MSIPKTDQFPEDPEDLTPARKRRADRGLIPEDLVEIADDIEMCLRQLKHLIREVGTKGLEPLPSEDAPAS